MKKRYTRPLKVSSPKGKRVYAQVYPSKDKCLIEINYLEVVKKDNPSFANNGIIKFTCEKIKYPQVILALEKYLEDLFLKGMSNENIYTSIGASPKPGRVKTKNTERKVRTTKREGSTSGVHIGSGGIKSSEDTRPRHGNIEVAESSDSSDSGEDKTGD